MKILSSNNLALYLNWADKFCMFKFYQPIQYIPLVVHLSCVVGLSSCILLRSIIPDKIQIFAFSSLRGQIHINFMFDFIVAHQISSKTDKYVYLHFWHSVKARIPLSSITEHQIQSFNIITNSNILSYFRNRNAERNSGGTL